MNTRTAISLPGIQLNLLNSSLQAPVFFGAIGGLTTLQDIIQDEVSIEATIYSDTWISYKAWNREFAEDMTVNS